MSSDKEEASHMIVVKGIHRLGESLFLEVEMSNIASLPQMKRGGALQTQYLDPLWNAA